MQSSPSLHTPALSVLPAQARTVTGPSPAGTAVILIGCLLSVLSVTIEGDEPVMALQHAGMVMGVALLLAIALEAQRTVMNLVRADIVILFALYTLLYAEFLRPPEEFYSQDFPSLAGTVGAISIGFGTIAVGRHLAGSRSRLKAKTNFSVQPGAVMAGLVLCAVIGYLPMLLSVGFDPVRLIEAMMGPRFTQPWTRGRLGGWADLLTELNMLLYLIPPLTAVVLANTRQFSRWHVVVALALLALTLFWGFSTGTRNIFFVFVASLLACYFLLKQRMSLLRKVVLLVGTAVVLYGANAAVIQFRGLGLSAYLQGQIPAAVGEETTVFVDNNIYTLSLLVDAFTGPQPYLGLEVPVWAVIKIVPRALWPGKPEGLSVAIEDIRETDGATWAATFIGEAFMSGGFLGVAVFGLLFGFIAMWWTTLIRGGASSDLQKLIYASGLFAMLITTRSMFWFTTSMLPTVFLILYAQIQRRKSRR